MPSEVSRIRWNPKVALLVPLRAIRSSCRLFGNRRVVGDTTTAAKKRMKR